MQDRELLKSKFLKKARDRFGDKFDYSKVDYVNCKTPIVIICPEHGEFLIAPERHLALKNGCTLCDRRKKSQKEEMTFEEFLNEAEKKYNGKFTYRCDNWQGLVKSKVIVNCPKHGESVVNPRSHISDRTICGCPKCGFEKRANSKTESYEEAIKKLKELYDGYYIYPDENALTYKNKRSRIKIICPKHGEFYKTLQKHQSGQGCHKCNIEHLIETNQLPGGYCETLFNEKPELKNKPAILYYLSINNGKMFKIGISVDKNAKKRIYHLILKAKDLGYNIEMTELHIKNYPLYEAFQIEQKILKDFEEFRIYTKWSTELFKKNIEEDIIKYFE